jgi:hypothetical protein
LSIEDGCSGWISLDGWLLHINTTRKVWVGRDWDVKTITDLGTGGNLPGRAL